MNENNKSDFDGIIFNLGGTLIDESASYRKCIELTVNNFVNKTLITQGDIAQIKSIGGFPNDWDTSYVFIKMFQDNIPSSQWHLQAPLYLPVDRTSELFLRVYDYFQTCFLGEALYQKLEGKKAPMPYDPGMIQASRSFVPSSILEAITKKFPVAIFTECPRAEVEILLNSAGIGHFFKGKIVAQEDVAKARPDPEGLLKAKRLLKASNPVYLGDDGSDFMVAQNADMAFGFVGTESVRTEGFLKALL